VPRELAMNAAAINAIGMSRTRIFGLQGLGLLLTAGGVGGTLGSWAAGRRPRRHRGACRYHGNVLHRFVREVPEAATFAPERVQTVACCGQLKSKRVTSLGARMSGRMFSRSIDIQLGGGV